MKKVSMRTTLRITLVTIAAVVVGCGIVVGAAAEQPNHANRLEATFDVTRLAIADHAADLGIRQVIASGTGTLEGFGPATEIVAVSIDLTVTPCGPGSNTTTILRRIVVREGTLVVKTLAHQCPTSTGLAVVGEYQVDGASSTGVFAGASGSGSDTSQVAPPPSGLITATISGKLHLAQSGD